MNTSTRLHQPKAVVIGAGIGGLATALDLVSRGLDVCVYESGNEPGGKMRQISIEGQAIDSGPTVLTMRGIFDELFRDAGSQLEAHLQLEPCQILARHAWPQGGVLDLHADIDQSAHAIAEFSDPAEARRYRDFCSKAQQVYQTLQDSFMRRQRPSPLSLVRSQGLAGLTDLWRIKPFQSLWRSLGQTFRDPRLRGLFARYATYCGSSPLLAPATLMLIAHVEQAGVWQVRGGMQRLAESMADLVQQKGGRIVYGAPVDEIQVQAGRATGIVLKDGMRESADIVVANADVQAIQQGLLGQHLSKAVRSSRGSGHASLSAITFSLLARPSGFELEHHNVFFPPDYPQEFIDIFKQGQVPSNPAVYICARDLESRPGGQQQAHSGLKRLFMITNAPAVKPTNAAPCLSDTPLDSTWQAVTGLLDQCGLKLDVEAAHRVGTTPADFAHRFPGSGGALYGPPSHGWRASFTRSGAKTRIKGLYLAGGSVHPGAGIPMVAISGRLAAEAAAMDFGLDKSA